MASRRSVARRGSSSSTDSTARTAASAQSAVGQDHASRHAGRHVLLHVILLVALGAGVYVNGLPAPPVIDDVVTLYQNPQIRPLWSWSVLQPDRELPVAGRPLVNLTFALNDATTGASLTGFRATNLSIHLLVGLALYALLRRMLALPRLPDRVRGHAAALAVASSLLWLVHPLTSEVVNYLTQRTESLMALCYLLTLYGALRAATGGRRGWDALAVVACVAGMACKESMVTAPVAVMFVEALLVFGSWRAAFARRRWTWLLLLASWIPLGLLMAAGPRAYSTGFDVGVGAWTYLLNQAQMLTQYLRLTLWPTALVVYYGYPRAITLADVWPQALLITALAGATLVALWRRPPVGLVGLWVFLTLSPTSSIVPIATEVGAERRMYLPLMALAVLATTGVAAAVSTAGRRWRPTSAPRLSLVGVAALAVVVLALGGLTVRRNTEYRSRVTLAQVTLARWPTGVAEHMVGEALLLDGRSAEAVPHLRAAIADEPKAHYTLGEQLLRDRQFDEGIAQLQAFIAKRPQLLDVPSAHVLIGRARGQQGRWADAEQEARVALGMIPGHPDARSLLADALLRQERVTEAIPAYSAYLRLRPDDRGALGNLAIAQMAAGRTADGVATFRRLVAADPGSGEAQRNLATALLDAGQPKAALDAARAAVALRPTDPTAHDLLGQALARQERWPEARQAFTDAVRLAPDDPEPARHLAAVVARGR